MAAERDVLKLSILRSVTTPHAIPDAQSSAAKAAVSLASLFAGKPRNSCNRSHRVPNQAHDVPQGSVYYFPQ
jgi:hypothetical protein